MEPDLTDLKIINNNRNSYKYLDSIYQRRILEMNGETVTDAACGNGPVDAVFKAIDRVVGKPVELEDYTLNSVSRGSEALGNATVKLRYGDKGLVVGRGISTNIIEASARAYANALSKIKIL